MVSYSSNNYAADRLRTEEVDAGSTVIKLNRPDLGPKRCEVAVWL